MLRVTDFNIVVQLDITSSDRAFTPFAQGQFRFILAGEYQGDTLEVEENFDNVFLHTLDGTVLVLNIVDFHLGNSTARHRRQQDATQGVAQGVTKTAFQGFQGYLRTGAADLVNGDDARGQKFSYCTLHICTCINQLSIRRARITWSKAPRSGFH